MKKMYPEEVLCLIKPLQKLFCENKRSFKKTFLAFTLSLFAAFTAFAQAPANDLCSSLGAAAPLISSTTCTNTAGTLRNATATLAAQLPAPACGSPTSVDVWYKFTANSAYPVITLSGFGASLSAATTRIQILSAVCNNTATIFGCGASPLNPTTALTIGTTYYVRITTTSAGGGTGGSATAWNFNICIVDPPANDLCSGAIALTPAATCTNTAGTLLYATSPSTPAVPGGCGNAASPDVWYSFVANTSYPQINLSSIGTNLRTDGRVHLLTGSCGALTSVYCHNIPNAATTTLNTAINPGGAGLTIGQTYYVRITHNTLTAPVTSGTYGFNICITNPAPSRIEFGKSYENKRANRNGGGSVRPGDTLILKTELVINSGAIDSLMFIDTLFSGRGLRLIPDSISLRTNEGVIYKSYTDATGDDAGYRYTNGLDTIIRINMGLGASSTARGKLKRTSKPSVFGGACIIMATYQAVVYAPYDTKIHYKTGAFHYRDTTNNVFATTKHFTDTLLVYNAADVCPDAFSPANLIGDEFGGTFGADSIAPFIRNRGTSPNVPPGYGYQAFGGPENGPNDYYYGIASNTSQVFTTLQNLVKPVPSAPNYRVFGVIDITGDHTNAVNQANGNPPCDTTLPISATNPCGYMLMVNSAYRTDTVFQYNASNLCENTYYEISAWFKNVCARCSCDSNGVGNTNAGFVAATPGDSSGVKPNVSFDINGINYYSTGNLQYLGLGNGPTWTTRSDTANKWVRRGFVYKLPTGATSLSLTLTNQAPGGGGNDWAIDDISIKTCSPSMAYSPSTSPITCPGSTLIVQDTVRSIYDIFRHYKWQRRGFGTGGAWVNVTGPGSSGIATPVWNGTVYQYVATYSISGLTFSNNGDLYRLVVATSAFNLTTSTCISSDIVPITVTVLPSCVLQIDFLSVSGRLEDNNARIAWVTSKEDGAVRYELQKSTDAVNFTTIATVNGYENPSFDNNQYNYLDNAAVNGKVYYRVVMISNSGAKKYSRNIELQTAHTDFTVLNVINPFTYQLNFDISSAVKGESTIQLADQTGRVLVNQTNLVYKGINAITVPNTEKLAAGIYILKVVNNGIVYTKKVMKQ
jgi:trimeric autotransporter adhesin